MAIDFESEKDGELTVLSNGAPKKTFKFDAVFGPQADQGNRMVDSCFGLTATAISMIILFMYLFIYICCFV